MADAQITRLINNALTRLPGATLVPVQQELFNVMDEFFKATNIWKEDIDIPIPGQDPAGTVYLLASTQPAAIDKLMWVFEKTTDPQTLRGTQIGAAMSVPGELTLNLQPSSDTTYTATVSLTVLDPANRDGYVSFPEWVLTKYSDMLLDGVVGRMMTQPSKPFTNMQMSVYHLRKFNSGKAQARVEATRNNTFRQQAWRFPGFARGSQKGRSSNWAPPQ